MCILKLSKTNKNHMLKAKYFILLICFSFLLKMGMKKGHPPNKRWNALWLYPIKFYIQSSLPLFMPLSACILMLHFHPRRDESLRTQRASMPPALWYSSLSGMADPQKCFWPAGTCHSVQAAWSLRRRYKLQVLIEALQRLFGKAASYLVKLIFLLQKAFPCHACPPRFHFILKYLLYHRECRIARFSSGILARLEKTWFTELPQDFNWLVPHPSESHIL